MYSLGLVAMLAMQSAGATLVPSALASGGAENGDPGEEKVRAERTQGGTSMVGGGGSGGGVVAARAVGDRLIGWATLISTVIAGLQVVLLPWLTPLFTTLPEVRQTPPAHFLLFILGTLVCASIAGSWKSAVWFIV